MNFKNLSYKTRNKIILTGLPVLLLLLWFLVFRQTYDLYQSNEDLKEKIIKAKHAPENLISIKNKLALIDRKIESYLTDTVKNRENILHLVSDFCRKENIILKEFPQGTLSTESDIEIETNKIITEGNFRNQLLLLHNIEYINRTGRPASVQFIKSFDNKRKQEILNMTIYLQNIRILKQ
jgi:hypothetical protein